MKDNLSALENMIYSGRGIIIGRTPNGNDFIGYSLTGRSPPSQARELLEREKTRTIRTSVTDKEQLEKGSPALLLYPAIVPAGKALIASNGAQTKLLYSALMREQTLLKPDHEALSYFLNQAFENPVWEYDKKDDQWIDITSYEPDPPNNTPRISALVFEGCGIMYSVFCDENGKKQHRISGSKLMLGEGKLITTYKGENEKPLLPFTDQPKKVIISSNTAEDIAESIYAAIQGGEKLGENYRVAAAVMLRNAETGDISTKIINRSKRGE